MKTKILNILQKNTNYISGEELSEKLGITRSAVWKHINTLKYEGYIIDSIRNKGYKLLSSPDILDSHRISSRLDTQFIGKKIILLRSTDSTNEEAKRIAQKSSDDGIIIAAEEQRAGKGRLGRSWSSGADGGLFFSLLMRPELPPVDIASITLASGYAVCLAIRNFTGLDARIKWPNDVIIGNKKLCGILTEMAAQSDCIDYVIIGIGVNVNNASFPEEISEKATSLYLETDTRINRSDLLAEIIKRLDSVISSFLVSLSIDDIENFKRLCATMGRQVSVKRGNTEITGTACDITPTGELIIQTDIGNVTINSGEVTVQGIY